MKINKKLLSVMLALMLIMPMNAYAYQTGDNTALSGYDPEEQTSEEKTSGNYTYVVLEDNTASLIKYSGDSTNVVVPDEIDGHKVSELFDTFSENEALVSVTVPGTVAEIGGDAFAYCRGLQYVLLGDGIETIGSSAFKGCWNLEEIRIPSSVTEIGASAFSSCTSLRTVTIPDSVEDVGFLAFEATPFLTENLSDFVIVGDDILICYKGSDPNPQIPDTVKQIGGGAFSYLFSPFVPASACTTYITSVSIPSSVTSIGYRAFTGSGITSINIPDSVEYVGEYAFSCTQLKSVTVPYTVEYWGESCFNSCEEMTVVNITPGVTSLSEWMFAGCSALTSVNIPESVETIEEYCFNNCSGLKTATLNNGLKEINNRAFYGCEALETITIPESVEYVESGVFGSCGSLTRIDFAGKNTDLEGSLCDYDVVTLYCYNDSKVHQFALDNKNVKYVLYDGTDTDTNTDTGTDTNTDTSTDVPPENNFEYEYDDAMQCVRITKYKGSEETVTVPPEIDGKPVTSLGAAAFMICQSIKTVKIPNTVTFIDKYAFSSCMNLTSVTIPDSVVTVSDGAFQYCSKLDSVVVPGSVKFMGIRAFGDNTDLTRIEFSDNNTTFADCVFDGCKNLKDIYFTGSEEDFNNAGISDLDRKLFTDNNVTVHYNSHMPVDPDVQSDFDYMSNAELDDGSITISGYKGSDKDVVVPSLIDGHQVIRIDNYAFNDNTEITSVKLPDTVTEIGRSVFKGCTSLVSVDIPVTVTKIEKYAFEDCASLESVTIPEGVTHIEPYTFANCPSLKTIVLPDSLTDIDSNAFSETNNVTIICSPGSYAEEFAKSHNMPYGSSGSDTEKTGILGDVNGDQKVTAKDSMLIQRYAVKIVKLDDDQMKLADVDGNGKVTNADSLNIIRYTIHASVKYPIGTEV